MLTSGGVLACSWRGPWWWTVGMFAAGSPCPCGDGAPEVVAGCTCAGMVRECGRLARCSWRARGGAVGMSESWQAWRAWWWCVRGAVALACSHTAPRGGGAVVGGRRYAGVFRGCRWCGYGVHLRRLALWYGCRECLRRFPCPCGDDVPEVVAGLTCAGIGSPAGVVVVPAWGAVAVLAAGAPCPCGGDVRGRWQGSLAPAWFPLHVSGGLLAGLMMAPCRGAGGG